jgi:DNA-binding CsgD family transcriptional regulator
VRKIGPDDPETEAVLSADGDVLHATGTAALHRRSLAEAVVTMDRARRRKLPDAEALESWNALVDGQWSILDLIESDGKRLLLARRNQLNGHDLLALTPLERDVAWLTAIGHSYKYIAYELGINLSGVVRRLNTVLTKLRLGSRGELVRAFALTDESTDGE